MTQIKSDQRREETRSAVERIGTFAAAARWEDLTGDVRRLFKRNILDSLGCAIAAAEHAGASSEEFMLALQSITQTVLKKYCALVHGQPVLEATLDLKRSYGLVAAQIEHVRCDIFQAGFDLAGGGTMAQRIIQ
jgi:2-methylcitrate dehydratase PrpD